MVSALPLRLCASAVGNQPLPYQRCLHQACPLSYNPFDLSFSAYMAEMDTSSMKKLAAFVWLAASFVFAQGNTSRLDGTVVDPTGAAIPGAEVVVTNIATDQGFKAATNERGEWTLPSMP